MSTPGLQQVSVIGVEAKDARIANELHEYIPSDCNGIYRMDCSHCTPSETVEAFLKNPPAYLGALIYSPWQIESGPAATETGVDDALSQREEPTIPVTLCPYIHIVRQSIWWTIAAWITIGIVMLSVIALVIWPGVITALLTGVATVLLVGVAIAHAGRGLSLQNTTCWEQIREHATEAQFESIAVIVPLRHKAGIVKRADADGLFVNSRELTSDRYTRELDEMFA